MTPTVRQLSLLLAFAALAAGCTAPMSADPMGERPYLVAVDALDADLDQTVAGTLVEERDCILLEDEDGLLLPLFAADPTRFGPRDGGAVTVDTGGERLRVGDEVTFDGSYGEVGEGLRSRYPGVDTTRCGVRRYALLGEVRG